MVPCIVLPEKAARPALMKTSFTSLIADTVKIQKHVDGQFEKDKFGKTLP